MLKSPETETNQGQENLNILNPEYALAYLLYSQAGLQTGVNNNPGDLIRQGAGNLSRQIRDLAQNPDYADLPFGDQSNTLTPGHIAELLNRIALGSLVVNNSVYSENEQQILNSQNPYKLVSQETELAILHITDLLVPNLQEDIQQLIQYRLTALYDQFDAVWQDKERLRNISLPKPKPIEDVRTEHRKRVKAEKAQNDIQIALLLEDLEKQIKIEDFRILDLLDEHEVPDSPVKTALNNQLRLGFLEAEVVLPEYLPSVNLRVAKSDRLITSPSEMPVDFQTKNSFNQNFYAIVLSLASLRKLVEKTPGTYQLKAELWSNSERRTLERMLNRLLQTNPDHRHSLEDLYQGVRSDTAKRRALSTTSIALVLAACASAGGSRKTEIPPYVTTGPQITAVITEGISSTPIPPEATPSAEPPGREVPYPSNTEEFLWDYDNSPPGVMSTLDDENKIYHQDAYAIEKFYEAVTLQEGMDGSQVDFVGSLGPESWVIAMKFQGEFYVLKEKEGLLLSAITPFAVLDQDPAGYALVKVKLDSLPPKADGSRYTHDDLRIYVDESKYHVIAVDGGKFYLDLTSDQWKDQNGNPVGTVEVLPTESSASFETGQWAEKEDGTLSPEKMFQLVGAIDYKHHKVVDLSYNGLKVAVVTGEDLTQKDASGFDDEKNTQADQINSNINLKAQLDLVRPQLDQNNLDKYTIVVENGAIKWIVDQSSDIPFYQKFENNKLVEVEVQLLPELRVNGPYIERADTGEKVQFAGGALVFIPEAAFYPETLKPFDSLYEFVKYYVEMAKSNDINLNIVRLGYDTKDVQEKPEEFEKTVRYLETQGIYVILDPHYANGEFLLFPTEDILEGQRKLASILKTRRNLIFGLQNEIGATAMKTYTWSDWAPWITKISDAIYENYQDQNGYKPIILVAGPEWNRDFRNAKIPISNYAIDLHQYKVWDSYEGGPMHEVDWWSQMIGNVPIFITENGALQMPPDDPWAEDLEFVENTLNTVSGHPFLIHYVLFMMSSGEGGNMFNQWKKGELTPKGLLYKNSQSTQKYTDFSD